MAVITPIVIANHQEVSRGHIDLTEAALVLHHVILPLLEGGNDPTFGSINTKIHQGNSSLIQRHRLA